MSDISITQQQGFFKRLGNWFNKNGNTLGRAMQSVGTTAMGVGMTGIMIHEMEKPSHCGSIWCDASHQRWGSLWSMSNFPYIMNNFEMNNYYNQMSLGMPYNFNIGSLWPMTNSPYFRNMGLQMAYQMGLDRRTRDMSSSTSQYNNPYLDVNQPQAQKLDNENNEFAELGDKGDAKAGEKIDDATTKLGGKEKEDNVKVASYTSDKFEEYKASISKSGQDYLKHVDSEYGNDDGELTVEEFVQNEVAKAPSELSESQAKAVAQIAFQKMDINGDQKLDWKEFSATLMTFDTTYGGKNFDGEIKQEDYKKWSQALGNSSSLIFDKQMRKSYKSLFKKTE